MTTSTTSAVYITVIEDVIEKVREEFMSDGGPGEKALQELQALWELKMMQAGAVLQPSERPAVPKTVPGAAITPVHDLNVPYEGTEEFETPTAEMLFPPTPLQTPIQTPLPGTTDSSMYNIPTGPTDYPTPNSNEGVGTDMKPGAGRPSPYMPAPSPWMNQRPAIGVDVNVAYVEGREEVDRGTLQPATQDFFTGPTGKRKRDEFPPHFSGGGYIPQQDGSSDIFELEIIQSNSTERGGASALHKGCSSRIPQLDGPIPDPYDDILSTPNIYNYQGVNEDYNVVNTPAPSDLQAGTPAPLVQNDVGDENGDDEPPLNENDDEDLDDIDQAEELNTQHLVLAQFDKVTRTKSRWKCTLKDGIMHISNKDILFNKASGEFDF
ncbi:transcription initiation factor IIA large subunit-like [Amaranthus tricolor]|uniref:transcription initiation factor IIA large subunit-like n=1 Tax=Amaranthus tricolor TaxID=29722 RepID=UPI002586BA39|nr:transcription initiation factor IIA large subunit-like [Amaranthus tricolor]